MAENDQYEELQKRIEALTKRVYNLEVQAGLRASQVCFFVRERRERRPHPSNRGSAATG